MTAFLVLNSVRSSHVLIVACFLLTLPKHLLILGALLRDWLSAPSPVEPLTVKLVRLLKVFGRGAQLLIVCAVQQSILVQVVTCVPYDVGAVLDLVDLGHCSSSFTRLIKALRILSVVGCAVRAWLRRSAIDHVVCSCFQDWRLLKIFRSVVIRRIRVHEDITVLVDRWRWLLRAGHHILWGRLVHQKHVTCVLLATDLAFNFEILWSLLVSS